MRQGFEQAARIALCESSAPASLILRASQYMLSNVALLVPRKAASMELGNLLREANIILLIAQDTPIISLIVSMYDNSISRGKW